MTSTRAGTDAHLRQFFIEAVDAAVTNQHLRAQPTTVVYIGELLARFSRTNHVYQGQAGDGARLTLADLYANAIDASSRGQKLAAFKQLGDVALFVAGLFSGSLCRKPVDVDYYVQMGSGAYGTLASNAPGGPTSADDGNVYEELSRRFVDFVDVLDEVGESSSARSERDLVRSYEIWTATGSRREKKKLVRQGVIPMAERGSNACH